MKRIDKGAVAWAMIVGTNRLSAGFRHIGYLFKYYRLLLPFYYSLSIYPMIHDRIFGLIRNLAVAYNQLDFA